MSRTTTENTVTLANKSILSKATERITEISKSRDSGIAVVSN